MHYMKAKASCPFKPQSKEVAFTVITTDDYLLQLLATRPPLATRLFLLLLSRLEPDGTAAMSFKEMKKGIWAADSNLSRGLKALADADIIAKKSRGRYYLNPNIARRMSFQHA